MPWRELGGTVQNDILKEYAARGTWIYPPRASMKLVADVLEFCSREVPRWNPISISGYHMREAGSTAVQEVAFTLAHGLAYVEAALARGLGIDEFAPRLSFFFNAHNDFLEEVAKFRAARRLWAELVREPVARIDVLGTVKQQEQVRRILVSALEGDGRHVVVIFSVPSGQFDALAPALRASLDTVRLDAGTPAISRRFAGALTVVFALALFLSWSVWRRRRRLRRADLGLPG